jgi:hypothetical protein
MYETLADVDLAIAALFTAMVISIVVIGAAMAFFSKKR